MRIANVIALVLVIVGGLNWGLVGVFEFNLVDYIFGEDLAAVSRVIYSLVGLAAVYLAVSFPLGKLDAEKVS